jgi:predicted cupin superfamily sugar epimerase/predicted GNAT family N-acyltransferase
VVTGRAAQLVEQLGLRRHPEGGWYSEVFRSASVVDPRDGRGMRAALTTIYFLLARGEQSRVHRVRSDESWHFYEGDPLDLTVVDAGFTASATYTLGPFDPRGMSPARVVPADAWQAARPRGDYSFVGCAVAPGFDFADFTLLSPELRPIAAAEVRVWRSAWLRPFQRPEELVYGGDDDPSALHLGAFQDGVLVGIASAAPGKLPGSAEARVWRLRGVAVHPELRGHGIGHQIIERCMAHALAHGGTRLWCHGRVSAEAFYRSLGFETTGEPFEVPGTGPHYVMQRGLP